MPAVPSILATRHSHGAKKCNRRTAWPWVSTPRGSWNSCFGVTGGRAPVHYRTRPLFGATAGMIGSTIGCLCAPPFRPGPATIRRSGWLFWVVRLYTSAVEQHGVRASRSLLRGRGETVAPRAAADADGGCGGPPLNTSWERSHQTQAPVTVTVNRSHRCARSQPGRACGSAPASAATDPAPAPERVGAGVANALEDIPAPLRHVARHVVEPPSIGRVRPHRGQAGVAVSALNRCVDHPELGTRARILWRKPRRDRRRRGCLPSPSATAPGSPPCVPCRSHG